MKNMDINKQDKLKDLLESGDAKAFAEFYTEDQQAIIDSIMADIEAHGDSVDLNNESQMKELGLRALSKQERRYYNAVIEKTTFDDTELVFPRTVFDKVFEDLRQQHPLLSEVQFVNTTGLTEWIFRTQDVEAAWWGKLCEPIKKQLENGFRKESLSLFKLSAFIPMCKSMLHLAPNWLDRFVREMLYESLALGLEKAIVIGTGNDEPIGITKDLGGAVVEGVYPDKNAVAISDFSPKTIGTEIMLPFVDGKIRKPDSLVIVVNPADYWGVFFPMTTTQDVNGNYHTTNLPYPFKVVQSTFMEAGKMVIGNMKDYFLGIGAPERIEYSDEYRFLEDDRVYIAKLLANGKPMTNTSFMVFDISALSEGGAVEEEPGA